MTFKNLTVLLMAGWTVGASAHPLKDSIRSLGKVADELAQTRSPNPTVKAKAKHLSQQVENIWLEALLAPVEISDEKLTRLGVSLKADEHGTGAYKATENENIKQLKANVYALKADGLDELRQAARHQIQALDQVRQVLEESAAQPGISADKKAQASLAVSPSRETALGKVVEFSETRLQCVEHAAKVFGAIGVSIIDLGGSYQWSTEDLRAKYGVADINQLTAAQKKQMTRSVSRLSEIHILTLRTCVAPTKIKFIQDEMAKLGGRQ